MLELTDIKNKVDKGFQAGQTTRKEAAHDMVFYHITHWDSDLLSESQLAYKGQFDLLTKAGRQIIADLASNPVSIAFEPIGGTGEDAADLADGLYRKESNRNSSIEAFENAKMENVVCGYGAWELYTKYVQNKESENTQEICRRPIIEANNCLIWDPNAKLLDKSDADWVVNLVPYSEDGYKELVKDLTGEAIETVNPNSFKDPEVSYVFPWLGGKTVRVYVGTFYHRELIKDKIITFEDPLGQVIELRAEAVKKVMDEMIDGGFNIIDERTENRYQITKYIVSGAEILYSAVIAGQNIPVVPMYGERAFVEGEEHYQGITRLAKDAQMLRDFIMSYTADIASRSPRPKPVFYKEQIAGYEFMYQDTGADNNYAYVLQNRTDANGAELPLGAIAVLPEQKIPDSLLALVDLTKGAVEDVANPGIPQDIADPDLSGKAVLALQSRLDMQSLIFQEHYKHARRRDAEIWISMAREVYDVPRKVKIEKQDGTKQDVMIMEAIIDEQTGDIVHLNDLRNAAFDITSHIGPSYTSKREQTVDKIQAVIGLLDDNDPMRQALTLKLLILLDGVDLKDIREYANKQLVLSGFKEPETDDEKALYEQSKNQQPAPDPNMVLAQAEVLKGQAANKEAEFKVIKAQLDAQNENMKRMIDEFKAMTDRMSMQIKAQETGANISYKESDKLGKDLDNAEKMIKLKQPKDLASMTTDELIAELLAA